MVAATFDRSLFACEACQGEAGRGRRESNSGDPESCDGPKVWAFFGGHPAAAPVDGGRRKGVFAWRGCPRRSLSPRIEAWIATHDRCEGRLSYTEARQAPMLLLEAFGALDYVRALREWEAVENSKKGRDE